MEFNSGFKGLNNRHVLTAVWGEASLKSDRSSPRNVIYYISVYTVEKVQKFYEIRFHTPY